MGGPSHKNTRKKNRRLAAEASAGEEFGLVPAKYLKRKAAAVAVAAKEDEPLLTPRSVASTVPASPFSTTSSSPSSWMGEPPQTPASSVRLASTGNSSSSIEAPSPLGASFRSPNPYYPSRGGESSLGVMSTPSTNNKKERDGIPGVQGSLKDTQPREVPTKTPPQRLTAEAEFHRILSQKGLDGGGGGDTTTNPGGYLPEWRRACLRAEAYDFGRATQRFRHQWRLKSELFGTPDLKVTIGDIAPNLVQQGAVQLVPTRDLAGRAVVFLHFSPEAYAAREREYRKYLFYMLASALEDEATQDHGLVLVAWNGGSSSNPAAAALSSLWGAAPGGPFDSFWGLWRSVRAAFPLTRLHYCVPHHHNDDDDHQHQGGLESSYSLKETREHNAGTACVTRSHSGSPQECLHALMTHGLPMPALPISASSNPNTLSTQRHRSWVEWRQRTDSHHHQKTWGIVLVPASHDVLFGRHPTVHAGNVRFHQMILSNVEEYRTATDAEQESIRRQIFRSLSSGGASFLQPLDPTKSGILWEPMGETEASTKIDKAFGWVAAQIDRIRASDPKARSLRASDVWDFGDPYFFTRECFALATCQRGNVCGGGGGVVEPTGPPPPSGGCWQLLSVVTK